MSDQEKNAEEKIIEGLKDIGKDVCSVFGHYVLDMDKNPVKCDDLFEWSEWMDDDKNTRVAKTEKGGIWVSTVFLGLDHSMGGKTPVLFETMIFGGQDNEYQTRCATYPEAVAMHKKACDIAFRPFIKRIMDRFRRKK